MKIVFATENPGKINEVRNFATKFGVEILSPSEAGLIPQDVEETGSDYETNARLKVEAYMSQPAAKDLIIIGDDTGIEIDALNGEPGIHTRRWLGYKMSDDEIFGYALGRLYGVKEGKRTAKFKSTVAYSINGDDIQIVTGELLGRILEKPLLEATRREGVPFRRLFIATSQPELPLWKFEEFSPEERVLSHRESAFKKLFETLKNQGK
jgi:XTP/dITP diphosphohydrolase